MRKQKNKNQSKILLEFMTKHPSLARGFCRGDKVNYEERWIELTDTLNGAGPPCKDITSWKKVWIDWRSYIHKKISHSNSDLTKMEKEVAVLCNLIKNDGIGVESVCTLSKSEEYNSSIFSTILSPPPSKKRRTDSNTGIFEETIAELSEPIRGQHETNDLAGKLDGINKKLDEIGKKYDILIELKKVQIQEMMKDRQERRRHNLEIEEYNNLMHGKYPYPD